MESEGQTMDSKLKLKKLEDEPTLYSFRMKMMLVIHHQEMVMFLPFVCSPQEWGWIPAHSFLSS